MQNRWRVNRFKKLLLAVLVVVVAYVGVVLALRAIGLDNVHLAIKQMGVGAPVAFLLLCTLSIVIAPISSSSLFVTGGVLFGQNLGFLLSFLSSLLGCCINFWISRKLGRQVATRLIGHESLVVLDRFTQRLNSHHGILFMILVIPLSQDIVSYAVGLTNVKFWQFFVALLVSGAAATAVYVYFGSGILEMLV